MLAVFRSCGVFVRVCYSFLSAETFIDFGIYVIVKKALLLGVGAVGLPGDLSSPSRFVRAAFLLGCLPDDAVGDAACDRLLSVLSAVAMTDGAVTDADGNIHRTTYSSCARPSEQKYTVKWADELSPVTVSLADIDLDSASLTFPTSDKRTNI